MRAAPPAGGSPPRLLVAVSLLVLAVTTVLAVLGSVHTGITTDEPIHVMRLRNFFDTGWYALDWDYTGDGPGSSGTNTFVYAPVTALVLHGWSMLWGVEGWSEVSTSPHAYDVRHLGIAMIGLVGVLAVIAIGRVLLRSWRWGIVAAAVLTAIPLWTGHEMFNIKDIPVATGSTLITLGLLCWVRADRPSTSLRIGRAVCVGGGLILTLGTRPGIWPGLLAVLVVTVAGIVSSARGDGVRRPLLELAGTGLLGYGVLIAIYPKVFGSPLQALTRSSESSASFLDGRSTDRLYVPKNVAAEIPTLLLVFILTGAVVGGLVLLQRWRRTPVAAFRVAVVGVQAFALPVAAIVLGSDLYHGLRQLLFATPACAVLAAYGMAWWLGRPFRPARRTALVLAPVALLLPVIDQVSMQPYQTAYVNLATDLVAGPLVDPPDRPGSDHWRVSLPELIQGDRLDRQLLCKAKVDKKTHLAYRFTDGGSAYSTNRSLDCREEPNGPLWPARLRIDRTPLDHDYDAVFLKAVPPNCTPLDRVTRRRHGFEVVLTVLARCTSTPPILTGGVDIEADSLGTGNVHDIWRFAADGWEQYPGEKALHSHVPRAVITFRASTACKQDGCVLVAAGGSRTPVFVKVNGKRVHTETAPEGGLLIPITATQARAADGVWVSFSRRPHEKLDLTLNAIRLVPATEGLS